MKPHFIYTADETARLWKEKQVQLHKAMNRSRIVRLFYAIRWKYFSNEIVMGLYQAFLFFGPLGGLLIAITITIKILESLNRTQFMNIAFIIFISAAFSTVGYIIYKIFRTSNSK